jgi:dihydroxyacid dehydratase/phosphogluconate dehydratase
VNLQPAGEYLGESFFRAGGVPAVMGELLAAGQLDGTVMTATGHPWRGHRRRAQRRSHDVIRPFADPLREKAGFLVLSGNLFDSALMKTSVISAGFPRAVPQGRGLRGRAVVFEGPEDYHARINDPALGDRGGPSCSSATWAAWAIRARRRW